MIPRPLSSGSSTDDNDDEDVSTTSSTDDGSSSSDSVDWQELNPAPAGVSPSSNIVNSTDGDGSITTRITGQSTDTVNSTDSPSGDDDLELTEVNAGTAGEEGIEQAEEQARNAASNIANQNDTGGSGGGGGGGGPSGLVLALIASAVIGAGALVFGGGSD